MTKKLLAIAAVVGAGLTAAFAGAQSARPHSHGHDKVATQRGTIVIDGTVTILVSPAAAGPVQLAAQDLTDDVEAVFGTRPKLVRRPEDTARTAIVIAVPPNLPSGLLVSGLAPPESFSISAQTVQWNTNHATDVILLAGADMRGTIYAIYQFAEEYLGVDPLGYWTDNLPVHRASIRVPAFLNETFPAPVFTYRGFFVNDEDLLTGWAPGEAKDKTGISLDIWNKIYETILRLKGNMVAPGTWIFPDEPQVQLAAKRGLIIAQHHAIPLGLNVARWPKDVPYNYSEHPEILERAWKNAVHSYSPGQEVLWTVGLRGLSDVTYAAMDPAVRDNNTALGALIGKAIADQMQIVRSVRSDAKFVTNLWQEGARLVQQGALKIPPEVSIVWADDGYGYLQDHGAVSAGQGMYDHVAMMNGRANQLTEMVPVERSFSEIGRYMKAGATRYSLVNTSDIRPVSMSIRAVMNAVWKGVPSGDDKAGEFYRGWSTEEFGRQSAAKLIKLYQDYFRAPAHLGDPVHEYGDQLYHTEARRMLLIYMIDSPLYALPSQAPKWEPARILDGALLVGPHPLTGREWLDQTASREVQQCGEAEQRWDAVWKEALAIQPQILPTRRNFYREQVLAMIAINRESNRILLLVSRGIQAAEDGDRAQAHKDIDEALSSFDRIQRAEDQAEYGKWKNWYRGDWLTGIYRTRELVGVFSKFLDDPETHLAPPVLWDGWEAYYHIMHYEGDRSVDVQ
jgi:hypothetical protein